MASWQIASTPVTVIPAGVNAPADYIFQNTGSNTIYISDQQNVTADSTSLAIAAGTPFTWSKSDPLYAVCAVNNPSTLFGTANGAQVGTSISALLTPTAQYVIAVATATLYRSNYTLSPGIYTIAVSPNTTIVNIDFYDVNGALITSVVSTSGSNLTINLATTVAQFDYWTNAGGAANVSISITKSGTNIPFVSGTLRTFTASGTPGLIGDAYIILVGAGGGGGGGNNNYSNGYGAGGGSGYITIARKLLSGTESLIIGTGGVGSNVSTTPLTAGSGGSTTFAGLTANGGNGASPANSGVAIGGAGLAAGGSVVAGIGQGGATSSTISTISGWAFATMGSVGGGGACVSAAGGGSGIGTGGTGGTSTGNGSNGGSGCGGGGSGISPATKGGDGGNGICYIII